VFTREDRFAGDHPVHRRRRESRQGDEKQVVSPHALPCRAQAEFRAAGPGSPDGGAASTAAPLGSQAALGEVLQAESRAEEARSQPPNLRRSRHVPASLGAIPDDGPLTNGSGLDNRLIASSSPARPTTLILNSCLSKALALKLANRTPRLANQCL
jgi:hypothetical protein